MKQKTNSLGFADTYETLEMLHISRSTLDSLVKNGVIDRHKFPGHRKNYYKIEQIKYILSAYIVSDGNINNLNLLFEKKRREQIASQENLPRENIEQENLQQEQNSEK